MKKFLCIAALVVGMIGSAQEHQQIPQISVAGEGKIKTVPDQALISISVDSRGNNAKDVKRQNDEAVENVLKSIRQSNLPKEDVVTRRVALNPIFDYEKKKYSYVATQTIEILLKDLTKYDALMANVVESGTNRISGIEFKSSKIEQLKSEARKMAIMEAKRKAEDYVSVLNQKVGKALTISDNTQVFYQQPVMYEMRGAAEDKAAPRETLAIGEIDVTANVSVSFRLE